MTKRETLRFKRVLEDMKVELACTLQNSLGRLVVSPAADPIDQICNRTEQELDSRNISRLMTRLRCLEDALHAIRDGNFGRCMSCDGEIPRKRLEAMPWSTSCVACQERAEARAEERGDVAETVGGGPARLRT